MEERCFFLYFLVYGNPGEIQYTFFGSRSEYRRISFRAKVFTFLRYVRANTFLDGFSEVGAVHHCVRQSFKIAAPCQPFSKPMQFFWQISGFPPRFVRNSGLKEEQRLVYIYCLKP